MLNRLRLACIVATIMYSVIFGSQLHSQVILISPDDPDFISQVNGYFPGILDIPGYKENIALFALLRNDGSTLARAYSVIWQQTDEVGINHTVANATFMYRLFTPPPDVRSLKPGQVRLVTPLFNISPDEYKENPHFSSRYPSQLFPRVGGMTHPGSEPKPVLDGVMTGQASFSGPNISHFREHYRCIRTADRDEVFSLMATQGSLNDLQTFRATLADHAATYKQPSESRRRQMPNGSEDLHDLYRRSRVEAINAMLANTTPDQMANLSKKIQHYLTLVPFHEISPMGNSK